MVLFQTWLIRLLGKDWPKDLCEYTMNMVFLMHGRSYTRKYCITTLDMVLRIPLYDAKLLRPQLYDKN